MNNRQQKSDPLSTNSEAVHVRCLETAADHNAYQAFLDTCPAATLYHGLPYKDLLMACVEAQVDYALAWRNSQVVGALPTMTRAGPCGQVINSLPFFGSHGDIIATDPVAVPVLEAWFRSKLDEPGVATATVISNSFKLSNIVHAQKNRWAGAALQDQRIGQWTLLDTDTPDMPFASTLFSKIHSSARRNIRKAEREGVQVSVENNAIGFLETCHLENMVAINGKSKPVAFFDALRDVLRPDKDYRIYVARHNGMPIAALLVFFFKQFADYIMPVTLSSARPLEPMSVILLQAMCDAQKEGRRLWNWGGTWLTQTGVYRFKKKWGAIEAPYAYHVYIQDKRILEQSAESLTADYPYFYVVPFSALITTDRGVQ